MLNDLPPTATASKSNDAMFPLTTGKAAAAAPQVTQDHASNIELANLPSGHTQPASDADANVDIMHLARLGDIAGIQKLYADGKYAPTYADHEGITPLHWAAINNRYALCHFLITAGANVNKIGGESAATPAMWAAQRCHYYVVNLLLENGADLQLTDVQGYNILHLATFDGNVFLLVLLLHQNGLSIDSIDREGHTPLMWAAYKGLPACIDLFLKWGADIHARDQLGFSALHWALVKGSTGCITKLLEYGADRFAVTNATPEKPSKTPIELAKEMHTDQAWFRALAHCGYKDDATPKHPNALLAGFLKDKRWFSNRFFFLWPFLIIWVVLMVASHFVVYIGIPLAAALALAMTRAASWFLQYAPSDMKQLSKTVG